MNNLSKTALRFQQKTGKVTNFSGFFLWILKRIDIAAPRHYNSTSKLREILEFFVVIFFEPQFSYTRLRLIGFRNDNVQQVDSHFVVHTVIKYIGTFSSIHSSHTSCKSCIFYSWRVRRLVNLYWWLQICTTEYCCNTPKQHRRCLFSKIN